MGRRRFGGLNRRVFWFLSHGACAGPNGTAASPETGDEQVSQYRDASNGKHHAKDHERLPEYARASIAEPNQNEPEQPNSQAEAKPAPFRSLVATNLRRGVRGNRRESWFGHRTQVCAQRAEAHRPLARPGAGSESSARLPTCVGTGACAGGSGASVCPARHSNRNDHGNTFIVHSTSCTSSRCCTGTARCARSRDTSLRTRAASQRMAWRPGHSC